MRHPNWAPEGIDVDTPSVARGYDYLLGGSHNFTADREWARKIIAVMPDVQVQARANRAFMHRAVRYLADAGVRQFLDVGSGIPTVGNVHEIAQRVAPESHVVYVDIDEVAVAHSEQILAGNAQATVIHEDARRPEAILGHPRVRAMLDFDRPVALLMVAVLHAIPDDDDPAGIVARLAAPLCSGSHLVIGHATDESRPDEIGQLAQLSRQTTTPFTLRRRERIEQLFAGFDLLPPGVVWAPQWRPGSTGEVGEHPEDSSNLVGVGHRTVTADVLGAESLRFRAVSAGADAAA